VSQRWKIPTLVAGGALVVATPLFWVLGDPDTGQLVAACVQGLTGVAAVVLALFASPAASEPGTADTAVGTGRARAVAGGSASTGIRRPRGAGSGSARAEQTGDATADGPGSSANTGIDYG
jgi:hypothetical protein